MRRLGASLVGVLVVGISVAAWPSDSINLTFEEGYQLKSVMLRGIETPRLQAPIPHRGGTGRTFGFTVAPGTQYQSWLSDTHVSSGRKSLAIKIYSNQDKRVKDKIQINIVKHDDQDKIVMGPDSRRFLSFDFMLDPEYETPRYWALHVQAWQCCGGHPPFAIFVTPSNSTKSDVEFRFVVRDDKSEQENPTTAGGTVVHKMIVPRGQWNHMTIQMEPSHNGDDKVGRLAMWHNGILKFDYHGDWGYKPGQITKLNQQMLDDISIGLGVYRSRQLTTQTLYFDNIRYGTTFESVTK